jgi:hypothetical protein
LVFGLLFLKDPYFSYPQPTNPLEIILLDSKKDNQEITVPAVTKEKNLKLISNRSQLSGVAQW